MPTNKQSALSVIPAARATLFLNIREYYSFLNPVSNMDKERTKRRILEKTERISSALQSRKFVCIALLFLLGTLAIPAQTTIVLSSWMSLSISSMPSEKA